MNEPLRPRDYNGHVPDAQVTGSTFPADRPETVYGLSRADYPLVSLADLPQLPAGGWGGVAPVGAVSSVLYPGGGAA